MEGKKKRRNKRSPYPKNRQQRATVSSMARHDHGAAHAATPTPTAAAPKRIIIIQKTLAEKKQINIYICIVRHGNRQTDTHTATSVAASLTYIALAFLLSNLAFKNHYFMVMFSKTCWKLESLDHLETLP